MYPYQQGQQNNRPPQPTANQGPYGGASPYGVPPHLQQAPYGQAPPPQQAPPAQQQPGPYGSYNQPPYGQAPYNPSGPPPPSAATYGQPPPTAAPGQAPPAYPPAQQPQQPYGSYPAQTSPYGSTAPVQPPAQAPGDHTLQWFNMADSNRTGKLEFHELQLALSQYTPPFNAQTVKLMLTTFDTQNRGYIDFEAFKCLIKYINDWKGTFAKFDKDGSGTIDANEMRNALKQFGYNVSDKLCLMVVKKYDVNNSNAITFPDFIRCCVSFKTLTEGFQKYDTQRNGWANMNYEQFLELAFSA